MRTIMFLLGVFLTTLSMVIAVEIWMIYGYLFLKYIAMFNTICFLIMFTSYYLFIKERYADHQR